MIVKIKKLVENAVVPKYAKQGDAGLDLTAVSFRYEAEHDCFVYGTGLALEIPKGYVGLIFPRSSNSKTTAYLTNSVGVIDSGYRGEIMVKFKNRTAGDNRAPYKPGDRVAQLIIMPYPNITFVETDKLSESERGTGGYGSTGS